MTAIEERDESGPTSALLLGVMGCATLGATSGIDAGVFAVVHDAAMLPASVALVTAVLMPALYIAASMSGVAIRISDVGSAVVAGLRASGVASLGLIAPVLFLLASTENPTFSRMLISAVLLFVGVLGLRAIHARLFASAESASAIPTLFLCWSLVFLGIGAKVIFSNLII